MNVSDSNINFFKAHGYLVLEDILSAVEVLEYLTLYNRFLDGSIDTGANRSDLGAGLGNTSPHQENITQIMWPSDFAPLMEMHFHQRCTKISKSLAGEDMVFDFDMLINKPPFSNTPTPWHQDSAYWIDLPDKRAISFWLALDSATLDNGCMWYVPGSHLESMRVHRRAENGQALICEATESEGRSIPLSPGSCVLHQGGTLHYSRGNSTSSHRRALIVNFRPEAMVALEREQGFDHGRNK